MMLRCVASSAPFARLAPALASSMHTTAATQAPTSAALAATVNQLQGLLGLSSGEVHAVMEAMPNLAGTKPSVLMERLQILTVSMGVSPARARRLIVQTPQLLGDLSMTEMRSMMGLSA